MHGWADVYRGTPSAPTLGVPDADLALGRLHQFSLAFGELLRSVLHTQRTDLGVLQAYEHAAAAPGTELREALDHVQTAAAGNPAGYRAVRSLMFHVENRYLTAVWRELASPQSRSPRELAFWWRDQAVRLAVSVIGTARDQERARRLHHDSTDRAWRETRATRRALLSEADTLIVVMTLCGRHPGWVVVPAPTQFEACHRRWNCDLILVDTARRRTVGIQVKSYATRKHVARYDPTRIVLVDAATDLEDSAALPYLPGSRSRNLEHVPGLIAAHTLAQRQPYELARLGFRDHRQTLGMITDAHQLASVARSVVTRVAHRLEQRIVHAL